MFVKVFYYGHGASKEITTQRKKSPKKKAAPGNPRQLFITNQLKLND